MSKKIKLYSTNRSYGVIEESKENQDSRSIDLVWTTGAKGLRSTRDGFQYYEELAVDQKAIDTSRMVGNPLLASHDTNNLDSVIGVIESVEIDAARNEGRAKVRFAKDEYSERVFQKVKDGIIKNVSVGYRIDEFKDVSKRGDDIPTYRAEKWTPFEISLVSIGFDKNAQVRADETTVEIELNNETIEEQNSITEPQPAQTNVGPVEAQRKYTMSEIDNKDQMKAAQAAEKTRQLEIRKAVRSAKLEETFADELCGSDVTVEEACKRVLEKLASIQPEPVKNTVSVEVGGDNQEKRRQSLEEALLNRIDSKNFKMTEGAREFHGKSLLRSIESILPRYSMESDAQYAKRAMVSADLPQALANVAEKGLQMAYQLQPRTSSLWSRQDTLRNYKQFAQVKAGDFGNLVERAEGANFAEATFTDEQEVVTLKDYGIIHAFSSQMLVNDDLGVIARLATQGGVAASRLENKLAYDALKNNRTMSDGVALFHATHGNLGAAGEISETTVAEAYKLMRKQSSVDGREKLNITPRYFVCGPDQEVDARKFFTSIIPNQTSNVNIWAGSMEIVVDANLTGNQYYFIADPSMIDTVTLYKLAGQEAPQIESRIKFENNNLELKVAHACAAEAMDWRGMVKNAGEA